MAYSSANLSISVIIPTYNRSQLLDFTLHALTLQSLPKNCYEVIVVDDGSTDDTERIVQSYMNRINVRYFYKEDKGYCPSSARNIGIKNASGTICLLVDSGVLLSSECVNSHLRFHNEAGSSLAVLGYVYGLYHNSYSEHLFREIIDPYQPSECVEKLKTIGFFSDIREKYYRKYKDNISDLPAPWVLFLSCNVSVSRKNLLKVGMFDENYDGRWGCEDNDLGYRLHKSGVKIELCRTAESLHYPHKEDINDKIEQGYKNCIYFNSKYNVVETKLFLKHYKEIAISESMDINEKLLSLISPLEKVGK